MSDSLRPATLDVASLSAAARGLAPLVAAHRAELARGPDLPAPLAQALIQGGLTRLWQPRAVGGAQLSPADYIRVMEVVAQADGAVGWCAAIASGGSRLIGLLPPDVARAMFGRNEVMNNVGHPAGIATELPGGQWRIEGLWRWGSFIRHATWTLGMCVEHDADGAPKRDAKGRPVLRGAFVPTADVRILDNWNAGGLRATGSHDFAIDGVIVPAERTIAMEGSDPAHLGDSRLTALPYITTFTIAVTAPVLGIARAAITALVALGQRVPTGDGTRLRDLPGVKLEVARAEATLRAARAFLMEAVDELWRADDPRAPEPRALVRLACWNVTHAGRQVVGAMHETAGGAALDESQPFAACLRDVHAIGQHLAFAQRHLENIGGMFLGLPPSSERF